MKYCKLVSDFNQDQIENILFIYKSFESPNVECRAWIQSFLSPCVLSHAVHRQSKKPFKDFTSFSTHGLHEQSLRDHFSWGSFFIPENNIFFSLNRGVLSWHTMDFFPITKYTFLILKLKKEKKNCDLRVVYKCNCCYATSVFQYNKITTWNWLAYYITINNFFISHSYFLSLSSTKIILAMT